LIEAYAWVRVQAAPPHTTPASSIRRRAQTRLAGPSHLPRRQFTDMADVPPPPPPRRFVTGHTPSGSSTIIFEGSGTETAAGRGKAKFFMLWHDVQPTNNPTPTEDNAAIPIKLTRDDGSLCRLIHMQPHHSTVLHRTVSLDYAVVLAGDVELELENVDGGANQFQPLKVGDVIIQRGTNHAWHNRGDTWAIMVFVMLGAEKIELPNGKTLEREGID